MGMPFPLGLARRAPAARRGAGALGLGHQRLRLGGGAMLGDAAGDPLASAAVLLLAW